jgi:Protein of unknown function (DUF2971)
MNPPCDPHFIATHPELHHYTTFQGLKGILETNTIWATHYRDLNDSTEVVHLKQLLVGALMPRFNKTLHDRCNRQQRRHLKANGGDPKQLARFITDSLYSVTFGDGASTSSVDAFITSFCTHADDKPYDRENGLLSQWRAYGADGGCCLVFDTAAICNLLAQEWADYWGYLHMSTVQYATDEVSVDELFPKLMSACDLYLSQILTEVLNAQTGRSPQHDPDPFLSSATLFKHRGFREEREARIVAIRSSQAVREAAAGLDDNFTPMPDRTRKNNGRRYVPLFKGLDVKLPIQRVIVGPSRNQARNCTRVRELLGSATLVKCSDTPFIGRPDLELGARVCAVVC